MTTLSKTDEGEDRLHVLHVKQPIYVPPSEAFVHARVINPICRRPIPVLTHGVSEPYRGHPEIQFYELNNLAPFRRRMELAIDYRLHWYPYYHQVIGRLRPQLIHAHFSGAGEACVWAARRFRIPLVINFYGIETNYHIHDPIWLLRYKSLFKRADLILCLSHEMENALLNSGCPPEKIRVIRLGVDTDLFCGKVTPWDPEQPLRLLSIARLDPVKGLAYLLEAGRLLNASGFNRWELSIVGIGPLQEELEKQAADCGISSQVKFLGRKRPEQIVSYLRQSHLMVLPSLKESQGVSLQEAQATSTPVIASRVGGIPEGVLDGVTGLLAEPGSPEDLVRKIGIYTQDPSLISKMGMAARQFVVDRFSRKTEYEELKHTYYSLVRSYGSDHRARPLSR